VESFAGMLPAIKITGPSHIDVHGPFFRCAVSRHQFLNRNAFACLSVLSHSGAVHTCVQICVS
jgi:hypothetical protein